MKETLERLWSEYLREECSKIETEEERELIRKTADHHESLNELLNKEQRDAVEEYVDSLFEMLSFSIKKAFIKGCEFSVSFLLESGKFGD